ncbi:MAG TPA: cytochrome D1 domain-containing protein, partial [Gaiellaceae bacterium]|nr:cytochrome D1 domain-containing protein [Gaiellaceae bacterium]
MRRAFLVVTLAVAAIPSSNAARLGGTPVALVTAETRNELVAVELPSGRILGRLHVPADPQNVVTTNQLAVVVSTRAGAVTLVDPTPLRIVRVFRGFAAPHMPAVSSDGRFAYVTDDARGQLVTIDLHRRRITSSVFVGLGAHHLAFRPRHHELWIVLGERARSIRIVDTTNPAHPRPRGSFSPAGGLMHDLAFPAGGRRVWIAYDDQPTVAVFDAQTKRRLLTLPAGTPPQHVAVRRYVYVTSGNDGSVRIFSVGGRLLGL